MKMLVVNLDSKEFIETDTDVNIYKTKYII